MSNQTPTKPDLVHDLTRGPDMIAITGCRFCSSHIDQLQVAHVNDNLTCRPTLPGCDQPECLEKINFILTRYSLSTGFIAADTKRFQVLDNNIKISRSTGEVSTGSINTDIWLRFQDQKVMVDVRFSVGHRTAGKSVQLIELLKLNPDLKPLLIELQGEFRQKVAHFKSYFHLDQLKKHSCIDEFLSQTQAVDQQLTKILE